MDEKGENRAREAAEELCKAARESYKQAVDRAFEAQKSNMRLTRRFFEHWIETLEDHAELNRTTMRGITELASEQREVYRALSSESLGKYGGFVDSLSASYEEVPKDSREPEG